MVGKAGNGEGYGEIRAALDGEELLDCEEVSVVVTVERD